MKNGPLVWICSFVTLSILLSFPSLCFTSSPHFSLKKVQMNSGVLFSNTFNVSPISFSTMCEARKLRLKLLLLLFFFPPIRYAIFGCISGLFEQIIVVWKITSFCTSWPSKVPSQQLVMGDKGVNLTYCLMNCTFALPLGFSFLILILISQVIFVKQIWQTFYLS